MISTRQPTVEEKRVVVGLVSDYLGNVVRNERHKLDETILWSEYLRQPGRRGGKEAYFAQVGQVGNLWNMDDNPLLGLTLLDVSVSGDIATVVLHKKTTPEDRKITVNLFWTGHGWMVQNDNLFGEDRLLKTLAEQRLNS